MRFKLKSEKSSAEFKAAQWVARMDQGLSPKEQDEYLEWLSEDSVHSEMIALHQKTSKRLNLLSQWRPEHSDEPNPHLLGARDSSAAFSRSFWVGGIAALGTLVSLSLWLLPLESDEFEFQRIVTDEYEYYELDDGSELDVNGNTELFISYNEEERFINMVRGEAFFTVAHDSKRPFIVSVEGNEFQAIGTAFNIKMEEDSIEMIVTEGKVLSKIPEQKSSGVLRKPKKITHTKVVESGARLMLNNLTRERTPHKEALPRDTIDRLLKWKPELLVFRSTALHNAVAEFNLRNSVKIQIVDHDIMDLRIDAAIRADKLDAFIHLLELTLNIESERVEENLIILQKKD